MNKYARRLGLGLLLGTLALAPGCKSKPYRPPPHYHKKKKKPVAVSSGQAAAQPQRRMPQGHVLFHFNKADLTTVVIPAFEKQAGIMLRWEGPPRTVTLNMIQSMPWQDALDLVCQFSKTHTVRDYQGHMRLEDGWSGRPTSKTVDELRGQPGKPMTEKDAHMAKHGKSSGSQGRGRGPTTNPTPNPTPFGSAYSGGEKAKQILEGTTPTHAGGH